MGQIYRITDGFSEGFYAWMTDEQKNEMLAQQGLTFFYERDGRRIAVFFDSSVDNAESRMLEKFGVNILIKSSKEELEAVREKCFVAYGMYKKDPQIRKTKT